MTEQNTDGLRPAAETMKPIVEAARQVPVHKHTEIQGAAKTAGAEPFRQEGYHDLARILSGAFDQSARGKGKERHGSTGVFFEDQVICSIGRMLGSVDFELGQAIKKITESKEILKRYQ